MRTLDASAMEPLNGFKQLGQPLGFPVGELLFRDSVQQLGRLGLSGRYG
jgi:hypothetical protein